MTLGILDWLSALGLPFLLGSGLLRCVGIRFRSDRVAWPAWSWMAGTLATAALLALWLCFELPLRAAFFAPVVAAAGLAAHWFGRRRTPAKGCVPRGTLPETVLLGVILAVALAVVADHMIDANREILVKGDETSIWAGKARVLFEAGGFNSRLHGFMHQPQIVSHADYPPLNPLLHLWIFTHAGEVTHVDNRVPIQLFAGTLLMALAAALRRQIRPSMAAVLLLLVSTVREFDFLSKWAYSDHLVALGLVVVFDAWLMFRATRDDRWWGLMCIGLGFMAWSKNESLLVFTAIGAGAGAAWALGRFRGGLRWTPRRFGWVLLPTLFVLANRVVNRALELENDLTRHGLLRLIFEQWSERVPILCERLRDVGLWSPFRHAEFGVFGGWSERSFPTHFLFAALLLTLALFPVRLMRSAAGAPALMLLASLGGFFLVFVGSYHGLEWHMDTALRRVYFGVLPATALWLALALGILAPALRAAALESEEVSLDKKAEQASSASPQRSRGFL